MLNIPWRSITWFMEQMLLFPLGLMTMLIVALHIFFGIGRRTKGWFYKFCLIFPVVSLACLIGFLAFCNYYAYRPENGWMFTPLWVLGTAVISAISVDAIYTRAVRGPLRLLMVFNLLVGMANMYLLVEFVNMLVFRRRH